MFAQVALITARLRQAMPSHWVVRDGTDLQPSSAFPVADIRLEGAGLQTVGQDEVKLAPQYVVRLAVHKTVDGLETLDVALAQSIACLHNWTPGEGNDRLTMAGLTESSFTSSQLFGYELRFIGGEIFSGFVD